MLAAESKIQVTSSVMQRVMCGSPDMPGVEALLVFAREVAGDGERLGRRSPAPPADQRVEGDWRGLPLLPAGGASQFDVRVAVFIAESKEPGDIPLAPVFLLFEQLLVSEVEALLPAPAQAAFFEAVVVPKKAPSQPLHQAGKAARAVGRWPVIKGGTNAAHNKHPFCNIFIKRFQFLWILCEGHAKRRRSGRQDAVGGH